MAEEREPTQAMPKGDAAGKEPRPTQPTDEHPRTPPKVDDEGFGGFMGHGGQSDITDESTEEEEGNNPNATAKPD